MSATTPEERLVTLEVLLREVLRRLDAEVTPRHTDHETRLRAVEVAVTALKIRTGLVATGMGTASGLLAALVVGMVSS